MTTAVTIVKKRKGVIPYHRGLAHYYPDLPDYITFNEAHAMFEAATGNIRNYLLLACMWYAGLRVSEALSLTLDHIRGNDFHIIGKGRKERYIPVKPILINDLVQYALAFHIGYHDKLFPISRCQAHRIINKYAQKAGLNRKVHCHLLRHGYGVNFLKQMPNLVYLQELLGHRSIETTRIYTRAALPDVREALEKVEM